MRIISDQAGLQLLNVLGTLTLSSRSLHYDRPRENVNNARRLTLALRLYTGVENAIHNLASLHAPQARALVALTACSTGQSASSTYTTVARSEVSWRFNDYSIGPSGEGRISVAL